jgi:hypothetical protein
MKKLKLFTPKIISKMATMDPLNSNFDFQLEKNELNAVLSSKLFMRAPGLINFLKYICEKYFEGNAAQIKEYNIATEALGRSGDFQQKEDPIVRVEANRLRKRLSQYYESEGADHTIRLTIPLGQYAPSFIREERVEIPLVIAPEKTENTLGPPIEIGPDEPIPPSPAQMEPAPDRSNNFPFAPWMVDEVAPSPSPSGGLGDKGGRDFETAPIIERGDTPPQAIPHPTNFRIGAFASSHWGRVILGIIAVVAVFFIGYQMRLYTPPTKTPSKRLIRPAGEVTIPLMTGPENSIRLMAGSELTQYVDFLGQIWQGDKYYSGGTPIHFPNFTIAVTQDPEIYRSAREGDFSYDIPLKPNTYELRLHFSENTYGPDTPDGGGESSRLINVTANGKILLNQFDILSDAGGGKTADIKVFKNITPVNGRLHLSFSGIKVKGIVSGIEVVPSVSDHLSPIRIATRKTAHFSSDQKLWEVDHFFRGGRQVQRNISILGTHDPELFQGERFGNFSYIIPVPQGRYQLNLYFVESEPQSNGIPDQTPPRRSFHVYCNGEALLKNFEIAHAAGGPSRALTKEFQGIRPNAQDKIILDFVPITSYATVSAIEIIPED